MSIQKRHSDRGYDAAADPPNPFEVINRFQHTDPRASMHMGALCESFCKSCQETVDRGERRHLCNERRCGLLDPTRYNQERLVVGTMIDALVYMESADPRTVDFFNQYVAQSGSVTMALVRNGRGHYSRGWNASTLRGSIHAAVLTILALTAGDIGTVHAEEIGMVGDALTVGKKWRTEWLRLCAARLYEKHVPVAEIVRRMDRSENTVRKWLKESGHLA